MASRKSPRVLAEAPVRPPDRSLTPDEPVPTMAVRAAGHRQFVYRKMVEGPVGAAALAAITATRTLMIAIFRIDGRPGLDDCSCVFASPASASGLTSLSMSGRCASAPNAVALSNPT